MKRILAILLAFVMLFAVVSCDFGGAETDTDTELGESESIAETNRETDTTFDESASNGDESGSEESKNESTGESTDESTDESTGESTGESTDESIGESTGESSGESTDESTGESDNESDESETKKNDESESESETDGGEIDWDPNPDSLTYVVEYPYTDRQGVVHITFQDTYTFNSKAVEITEQNVTSFKTGSNTKDDAVLVIKDGSVYAAGCGVAVVKLEDGSEECVVVHASPINLFFLTGQSNGSGDPPSADCYEKGEYQKYFVKSPETMAYYTWTGQGLSIYTAEDYVTKSLVWGKMGVKNGCNPDVLTKENYTGGFANFSVCAGLAHEWIKQTGERIWIVNASHGGQPIHCFKPSEDGSVVDNDYYQAITVFNLALDTLYREVDAGHFTLNHMAYYWFQGEGDSTNTYDYYYKAFAEMHEAIQEDVVYKHNGVEKRIEYCGYFTIRSGGNSVSELYLTGPRLAQYTAANQLEGPYKNVFLATKATENWIISDANVKNYFLDVYGSNEAFKEIFGYDIPSTLKTVHPQIHYRIFGQNEMGMDAARNTLKFLNYFYPDRAYRLSYALDTEKPELKLVSLDGYTELTDTLYFDSSRMEAHIVPYITPVWRTVEGLSIKVLTPGFEVDGFKITNKNESASRIIIEIYLGDKLLDTRVFKIKFRSNFADNKPLIVNHGTSLYPDRRFEGYMPGWDAGFLNFNTNEFEVFTEVQKDGWLYDGSKLWDGHGGILATGGMLMGPPYSGSPYSSQGAIGIRYTATKAGTVKISTTNFGSSAGSFYVAVFVNGDKVWPQGGTSEADKSGWELVSTSEKADAINEMWKNITIDIGENETIVFAVARHETNPQATFYPSIEYID